MNTGTVTYTIADGVEVIVNSNHPLVPSLKGQVILAALKMLPKVIEAGKAFITLPFEAPVLVANEWTKMECRITCNRVVTASQIYSAAILTLSEDQSLDPVIRDTAVAFLRADIAGRMRW